MIASLDGHFDIVCLLLQSGAVVDSRNNDGATALTVASSRGHMDIVHLLLQTGAALEAHTDDGKTPLMLASERGHADIVDVLLQSGAAVDFCDNRGWTLSKGELLIFVSVPKIQSHDKIKIRIEESRASILLSTLHLPMVI